MNIHSHPTKKIGVRARPAHTKTCKLAKYLDIPSLPTPPAEVNCEAKSFNSMQMFLNDKIGDCGVAGYLHHKEIVLQSARLNIFFGDDSALKVYQGATAAENGGKGYDPSQGDGESNPTDTGLILVDFLEYLRAQGLILAHAEVDLSNDKEVQAARYLFGGIYRGFDLPEFTQNLDDVWYIPKNPQGSKVAGSWGGHCVNDKARLSDGSIKVTSWGKTITVKPDFLKAYQSEGHIIVHKHSAVAFDNLFGADLSLNDLIADLNQLKK
jgi:hypothetical protein